MSSSKRNVSALVFLAAALLASTASAKVTEDFERVVPFEAGGSFSIQNVNGSIDIETWNDGSVRIQARKEARTQEDLDAIEIVVDGAGTDVSVRTLYPRHRGGGQVSYRVSIPANARVAVETVNGAVSVTGIQGRVRAESVNGGLKLESIDGEVEAETTNGSIETRYRRAAEGRHRFETTNGSVRIYLPSDAGGEVEAETSNGSIEVDFPMTVRRSGRHHLEGSFGSGGSAFQIETVNGSVKLLAN
jgi:hypothetical protein